MKIVYKYTKFIDVLNLNVLDKTRESWNVPIFV